MKQHYRNILNISIKLVSCYGTYRFSLHAYKLANKLTNGSDVRKIKHSIHIETLFTIRLCNFQLSFSRKPVTKPKKILSQKRLSTRFTKFS